jgi:Na+/proline symporter
MVTSGAPTVDRLPFLFALGLAVGSLITYLAGALVSRFLFEAGPRTVSTFNLGIPKTADARSTFAMSLAAAQTTLSTVCVAFLTDAGYLGFHLLYCPIAFAVGNWIMVRVYERLVERQYVDKSVWSGLLPHFFYLFTRDRRVAGLIGLVCIISLLAMLALELLFGIEIIDYLGQYSLFPTASDADARSLLFVLFVLFIVMLFSYVFVGGFRAVITSDIWQCRIMLMAFTVVLFVVLVHISQMPGRLHWSRLLGTGHNLTSFYLSITIINLFEPLSIATTWQRFRAFNLSPRDLRTAVRKGTIMVVYMWITLITIGIGATLISDIPLTSGQILSFLGGLLRLGPVFQYVVFPLLVVACLSGMYSSSDTCVSSLMYLSESFTTQRSSTRDDAPLKRQYYWIMAILVIATFAMYIWVSRASVVPVRFALSLFGNVVAVAPSLLVLTLLGASDTASTHRKRSIAVVTSIVLWFLTYWTSKLYIAMPDSQWNLLAALLLSSVPCVILYWGESVRSSARVRVGRVDHD